ncbi:bublin coiled-coil protein [Euwallacea similis]|uniref:bublin coiled-coil protein n=1 Tax=Euwallacea similis TaxID=1736056 RepID=UPI00344B701B
MGEKHHKDVLDNTNSNNPPTPPEEPPLEVEEDESEELTLIEYQQLNNQLDALFTALDDIENKNDNIHAQLLQLLNANREIRKQLNGEVSQGDAETNECSEEKIK